MKRSLLYSMSAAPVLLLATLSSAQAAPTLPTPDCGTEATNNCLVFDDFTVYSLALLNFKTTGNPLGPGEPFQVDSSGNAIQDALVIVSHTSAAVPNQHLGLSGGVDNAYYSPDNIASGFANYLMTALNGKDGEQQDSGNPKQLNPDPGTGFLGDNVRMGDTLINNNSAPGVPDAGGGTVADGSLPLWDITTEALNDYLGGESLVFYFNLNEENGGTLDSGQDMLVYADVYLTDFGTDGAPGGDDDMVKKYTLSGNYCSYGLFCPTLSQEQTAGVDDILPNDPFDEPDPNTGTEDNWAYVHGEICVADDGALLNLGPCTGEGNTVNQNLGATPAAFGIYSAELDNDVKTGAWDIMSVDLRMGHIGNGYEQLFILPTTIPEPGTLGLASLGLFGLYRLRRRNRQKG